MRICALGRLVDTGTSGGGWLSASDASMRSEPGMAAGDGI